MAGPWTQKATKKGDGDGFPKAPTGNHPAVLVAIVDLGTQENNFQGNVTYQRRAYFCWELVTEEVAGYGRNHVIGIDLTISLSEKAKLRQWIEARVGRQIPEGGEYDVSKELGQKCLLSVKDKNGYPKVDGMSAVPKGMTVPAAKNEPFIFSLDDLPEDPADLELPDWLPYHYGRPLKEVILECGEVAGNATAGRGPSPRKPETVPADAGGKDEDIPF